MDLKWFEGYKNVWCKDANPADDSKWTPLIIAASAGHVDVARMLIGESGVYIFSKNNCPPLL